MALVGDFDPTQAQSADRKRTRRMESDRQSADSHFPRNFQLPTSTVRRYAPIPGKTQSVTLIGSAGIDRRDPRYLQRFDYESSAGRRYLIKSIGSGGARSPRVNLRYLQLFSSGQPTGAFCDFDANCAQKMQTKRSRVL